MSGPDGRDAYADGSMAIAAGRMRNAEGLYGASAFFSKSRRSLPIRVGQDQNELFAACTRGSVACAPDACSQGSSPPSHTLIALWVADRFHVGQRKNAVLGKGM